MESFILWVVVVAILLSVAAAVSFTLENSAKGKKRKGTLKIAGQTFISVALAGLVLAGLVTILVVAPANKVSATLVGVVTLGTIILLINSLRDIAELVKVLKSQPS